MKDSNGLLYSLGSTQVSKSEVVLKGVALLPLVPHVTAEEMFEFFGLPLEVRRMVYAECLVVGKVYPYTLAESYDEYECDFDDDLTARELAGKEAPEVTLLRVCKDIHLEAEAMLYQRNTFMLPVSDLTARFFKRSLHNDTRRAMIKSVRLFLGPADLTRDDREVVLDEVLEYQRDEMLFPEKAYSWSDDLSQELHDAYKHRLGTIVWPRKASFILGHLQLDKLVIDLVDAKCIEGCCFMRALGVQAFQPGFAKAMPKRIEVLGVSKFRNEILDVLETWTARRLLKVVPGTGRKESEVFDLVSREYDD